MSHHRKSSPSLGLLDTPLIPIEFEEPCIYGINAFVNTTDNTPAVIIIQLKDYYIVKHGSRCTSASVGADRTHNEVLPSRSFLVTGDR